MDWSVLRQGSGSSSGPLSFLSSLPPLTQRLCFAHASFSSVPAHTTLFHEDDCPVHMVVVLSGSLSVFVRNEEGDDVCLGGVRRGESIGAMGLMYGSGDMHAKRRALLPAHSAHPKTDLHPPHGPEESTAAATGHSPQTAEASLAQRRGSVTAASRRASVMSALLSSTFPSCTPASAEQHTQHRYSITAVTNTHCDLALFDRAALSVLLLPSTGWSPPFLPIISFLQQHPLLLPLSHYRLLQLTHACRPMRFSRGEYLLLQGHDSDGVHFIVDGDCELLREVEGAESGPLPAKARDLVVARAGPGELIGDCCVSEGQQAAYLSVRAVSRLSTLYIPRLLFLSVTPRSLQKALREEEGRRRQHRQQRVATTMATIAQHVRVIEVARSARKRSPMVRLYEDRDREDRREGHRAKEHRRAKGENPEGPFQLTSGDRHTHQLPSPADDSAGGPLSGMEELRHCFEQLLKAREGNVTRSFGVRKRWRYAITAIVYILRLGMSFLIKTRDERVAEERLRQMFKDSTAPPQRTPPRRQSAVVPAHLRSGSVSGKGAGVGGGGRHVFQRRASVSLVELDHGDAAMERITEEEKAVARKEDEAREHLQRLIDLANGVPEPGNSVADAALPRADGHAAREEEAMTTFLTGTDDMDEIRGDLPPPPTAGSSSVFEVIEGRLRLDEPVTGAMEDGDQTSLSFLRRDSVRPRRFVRVDGADAAEQREAKRLRAEREAAEQQQRSAQRSFASLWVRPIAASTNPRASSQPSSPTFLRPLQPILAADAPATSPWVACLRLSSVPSLPRTSDESVGHPALAIPDVFFDLFASTASLRAIHTSTLSSFLYLTYSHSAVAPAAVEVRLVEQLRGMAGWERVGAVGVLCVDWTGAAGLELLWGRAGQRGEDVSGRPQTANGRTGALQLRERELAHTAGRLVHDLSTMQRPSTSVLGLDDAQDLRVAMKASTLAEERKERMASAPSAPPLLPPSRFPPLSPRVSAPAPKTCWRSPFSVREASAAQARRRARKREQQEADQRAGYGAGDQADEVPLHFGGGIVKARRLVTSEVERMTRAFARSRAQRHPMQRLIQAVQS